MTPSSSRRSGPRLNIPPKRVFWSIGTLLALLWVGTFWIARLFWVSLLATGTAFFAWWRRRVSHPLSSSLKESSDPIEPEELLEAPNFTPPSSLPPAPAALQRHARSLEKVMPAVSVCPVDGREVKGQVFQYFQSTLQDQGIIDTQGHQLCSHCMSQALLENPRAYWTLIIALTAHVGLFRDDMMGGEWPATLLWAVLSGDLGPEIKNYFNPQEVEFFSSFPDELRFFLLLGNIHTMN